MKNRLSTLLMVLLSALMVTCSKCGTTTPEPVLSGKWTIVSITASNGLQAKYAQALTPALGTFEIGAVSTIKTSAGAPTTDGSGASVITKTDAKTGKISIAFPTNPAEFAYSGPTANGVVLTGNTTPAPGKMTVNTTVITLKR